MKPIRLVSLAILAAALAPPARAGLLLYDGFATITDGKNRTPYSSAADACKLQGDNARGDAWTAGVSGSRPWSDASAVVFTFPGNGLALPAVFADGSGSQFTARGGSVGWQNPSDSGQIRGKNRGITADMPSTGTLYYRCLMRIEADALARMKVAADRYAAAGLSSLPATNSYANGPDLAKAGFRVSFAGTGSAVDLRLGVGTGVGTTERTLVPGVSAGTTYLCIVAIDYDRDRARAYAAPIANYSTAFAWTVQDVDASAITADPVRTMFVDGVYQTNGGRILFDEFAAGTELSDVALLVPATAPVLGDVSLARTGPATYAVAAEEAANAADLFWIAADGTSTSTTNLIRAAVAAGASATGTVSRLASDRTWRISVLARNADGSQEKAAGTLYAGALSLGATTNAQEFNLTPGSVTVSRANADPWPLTVNYTISGSAGAEGTTWAAPEPVEIPAGAAGAVLPVVPLMDGDVDGDITITVALAPGNYEIPAAGSATLTLVDLSPPAGKKTWVAVADGLASDGANWLPAGRPAATDDVFFDGNFSTARCTWDAAATHAVASWEQTASYAAASGTGGVVDFDTTYGDGDFPAFAIAGDCTVAGGKWTHRANAAVQTNRLSVTVGGDFTVGAGAEITASNKGFAQNRFPAGSAIGVHGGSVDDLSKVYGDFRHPVDLGAGGGSQNMSGGGAIHLVVAGAATVDGLIAARPNQGGTESAQIGAGGSIYLEAASVAGSGSITAAGWGSENCTRQDGAGGRVAIVCTAAAELAFPKANIRCNGSFGAYGRSGGGGTAFVKTAAQRNGTLVVANSAPTMTYTRWWPTKRGVTPIPAGQTWTLDALEFRGMGVLCVPVGTSLTVPLSAISSSSAREAGILYEGGSLDFGPPPYTLSGNWTFCADAPYAFDGDVTVTGGANIGGLRFSGHYTNDFAKCDVAVGGNLTIAGDGYASVELAGPCEANGSAANGGGYPMHGGQYAGRSGNQCYDSVFDPAYPGHFARNGDQATFGAGGGALKLTVSGDLVVDGRISADGVVRSYSSAAGGSVDIRARTLSGSGLVTASGRPGAIQWNNGFNGAGGRIAVRVTGGDVGTDGVWATLAATGCSTNQVVGDGKIVVADRNRNASAGTVYLQGASDREKGGTVYVRNLRAYDTSDVATWLPAGSVGDAAADFHDARLVVADRGVVAIDAPLFKMESVSIEAGSRLDLRGNRMVVLEALLDGRKTGYGTFTAASPVFSGYLADSVGGGALVVAGRGTMLILK